MRGKANAVIFLCFLTLAPSPAWAWGSHRFITRRAFAKANWLDRFRNITVTPYDYRDPGPYHPGWKAKFYGKGIGKKTSAREILTVYSSEPDLGMDSAIWLSPLQFFMGGSHGYRHQLYRFGPFRIGEAPARAAHFYQLSEQAFAKGDTYWGFRFFACSLHYLEDLGQPLHNKPLTLAQIAMLRFNPRWIVNYAMNIHIAYETYVAKHLERGDDAGKRFIEALQESQSENVQSIGEATRILSDYAYSQASKLLQASEEFWPARVRSKSRITRPTEAEIFPARPSPGQSKLDQITEESLSATGGLLRGTFERLQIDISENYPRVD